MQRAHVPNKYLLLLLLPFIFSSLVLAGVVLLAFGLLLLASVVLFVAAERDHVVVGTASLAGRIRSRGRLLLGQLDARLAEPATGRRLVV